MHLWVPSCIKNSTSVTLLCVDIKHGCQKFPFIELKLHLLPQVYLDYARQYGCKLSEEEVLANFWRAFNTPWTRSALRYEGDGWPFWCVLGASVSKGTPYVPDQSVGAITLPLHVQKFVH